MYDSFIPQSHYISNLAIPMSESIDVIDMFVSDIVITLYSVSFSTPNRTLCLILIHSLLHLIIGFQALLLTL